MPTSNILNRGVFAACLFGALSLKAQDREIDAQKSVITIHVGKAGLLSAAGHEHWVTAPISTGELNDASTPHVAFTVDAHKLQVKHDDKVSSKDEAEIQDTMQRKV